MNNSTINYVPAIEAPQNGKRLAPRQRRTMRPALFGLIIAGPFAVAVAVHSMIIANYLVENAQGVLDTVAIALIVLGGLRPWHGGQRQWESTATRTAPTEARSETAWA